MEAVAALVVPYGATVTAHEREIAFLGDSATAYFDLQERTHPMALASRRLLEQAGSYEDTRAEALAALEHGNESPATFDEPLPDPRDPHSGQKPQVAGA